MDAANFKYTHPSGDIFGYFTEVGLRSLMLPMRDTSSLRPPRPAAVTKRPYLLHDAPNRTQGRYLTAALDRYFSGIQEDFESIPLDLSHASGFQREVWAAARNTPHGSTSTYGALAEAIGAGKPAARAVGAALGQNPIAIIIPCHRFIAANGKLVNFAAGLEWKRELLMLEGALIA